MPRIGLNRVMLIGRVASTPRFKLTPAKQTPRLWFRVRTDEQFRDQHGLERERKAFHSVVVWGKQASALQDRLAEHQAVAIEGRLSTSQYELDGKKRYEVEIVASSVVTLSEPSSRADAA